jgi:hypothetical protein
MLKRTVVRLLLFGIPCSLSYFATRPPARATAPAFVICSGQPGQEPRIVIAPNKAACATQPIRVDSSTKENPRLRV